MITAISTSRRTSSAPAGMVAVAASGPGAGCEACPHLLTDHDAIGSRFCRATVDGDISRGCVCDADVGGLPPARRRKGIEAAQWAAGTTARRVDA
jgi:hypothetical protein